MRKEAIIGCLGIAAMCLLSSCCKTCRTCKAKEMMCSCNRAKEAKPSFTKNNGVHISSLKPPLRKGKVMICPTCKHEKCTCKPCPATCTKDCCKKKCTCPKGCTCCKPCGKPCGKK